MLLVGAASGLVISIAVVPVCCNGRQDRQYQAALKRLAEVEQQHECAVKKLHEQELVMQQKQAELVAAKQGTRNAAVKVMASTPSGTHRDLHCTMDTTAPLLLLW